MSRGLNKVMIIGHLGKDPDIRVSSNNGSQIVNIRVATSESWKDKVTGEKKENTEWHKVVIYNKIAELAAKYLKKGSKVYLEGSLKTRKWQDQNGVEKQTTEIICSNFQILDSKPAQEGYLGLPADVNPAPQPSIDSAEDELDDVPF